MKLLFCNIALRGRSGTERFLWDLTCGLKRRGHDIGIFSPRLGVLADELRSEGIRVWSHPREVDWTPDLLHCQHTQETWLLLAAFPTVPALYMCHDARIWFDSPPPRPLVSKYVAVDAFCQERVAKEIGCDPGEVALIYNGVDLQKFRRKERINSKAERALLFVSEAPDLRYIESVRMACRQLNLPLDEIGGAVGKTIEKPEEVLGQYDIVFAKARCALEAMACGCAVVLVGAEGLGPLVMPGDFEKMRARNFGRSLLQPSFDANLLVMEIRRFNGAAAAEMCDLVRTRCGLDTMVEAHDRLYAEIRRDVGASVPARNEALFQYGAGILQQVETERAELENAVVQLRQAVVAPEDCPDNRGRKSVWSKIKRAFK